MGPGTQLIAPAGFRALVKKRRYHFVYRDAIEPSAEATPESTDARVVLAWFSEVARKAHLQVISAVDFDYGMGKQQILVIRGTDEHRFPPWLHDRERDCVLLRQDTKGEQDGRDLSDAAIVDGRCDDIAEAVDDYESFFASHNPIDAINAWAGKDPSKNQGRLRNWFITYIAFGFNRWALLPAKSGRGRYDRQEVVTNELLDEEGKVRTIERRKGSREQGYPVTEDMKEKMVKGFTRFAKLGSTLAEVFEETVTKIFGCTFSEAGDEDSISHPQGKPFPTYGQYRYWVIKVLGDEAVWSKLRGPQWYRTHRKAPKGSFAEGVQDLLEKIFTDAASSKELPRSYFGEGYTPPLVECVIVDAVSRMRVGVAFGIGVENESLYKQALASMALPKSLYAEVLNLPPGVDWDERLPVEHIPVTWQSDRGPGAAAKLRRKQRDQFMSADMSASYTPQSQAEIEGAHPRSVTVSGGPTYRVSTLPPLAMARQRFIEIVNENRKPGIRARLNPQEVALKIRSPLQLWKHRMGRERIAGRRMKVEDVITEFLPQRTFQVRDGFLEWAGQRYRSREFAGTEFAKVIRKHEGEDLTGYSFDISNLVAWVLVDKRLIKVNVVRGTRDRLEEFALTSYESALHAKAVQVDDKTAAGTRRAVGVRNRKEIPELTGMPYKPVRVVTGRAKKRTAEVQAELAAHRSL